MGLCEKLDAVIPIPIEDWFVSVVIGFLVVSYWRGLWTLFDIYTCDQPPDASPTTGNTLCLGTDASTRQDSAVLSYVLGVISTIVGVHLMWFGGWKTKEKRVTPSLAVLRFVIILILGFAATNTWRGIWYLTDEFIYGEDLKLSYWFTTIIGALGAFLLCAGGSLLAPPAIFLLDGPSVDPPPVAVTILATYYSLVLPATSELPKLPLHVCFADALISFFGLPILVVWFWRGSWGLMDIYLWDFSEKEHDLNMSMLWSTLIAVVCCLLTSEPVLYYLEVDQKLGSQVIGRVRTFVLAFGTVNFWRVVWDLWDQYIGGTSLASAWTSYLGSLACLLLLGCASSTVASPATLGVDVVPHPEAADEPLFSMLPLPWELLYVFAIARDPTILSPEETEKKASQPPPSVAPTPTEEELVDHVELPERQPVCSTILEEEEVTEPLPSGDGRPQLRRFSSTRQLVINVVIDMREASYHEFQRPHLSRQMETRHLCCQRPSLDNQRHRSQYFRNR